jgi:hypothetical protein
MQRSTVERLMEGSQGRVGRRQAASRLAGIWIKWVNGNDPCQRPCCPRLFRRGRKQHSAGRDCSYHAILPLIIICHLEGRQARDELAPSLPEGEAKPQGRARTRIIKMHVLQHGRPE